MSKITYEFKTYLRRLLKPRKKITAALRHDHNGVNLETWKNNETEFVKISLAWSDIHNVRAFKREQFLDNSVCLLFSNSAGVRLEVDEEMPEWESLISSLPNYLEDFPQPHEWYRVIGSYSLAPNWKVLYHADYPEEVEED